MTTHTLTAGDDPHSLLEPEWLLTNQTGAYAMGSAAGCNRRRYHGLLVAAASPPVGRVVALNQVLEQLFTAGARHEFTTCQFRNSDGSPAFAPQGMTMLEKFERGLTVKWTYAAGDIRFSRELLLHPGEQAATLRYRVAGLAAPAKLRLSPMLTMRDFHQLLRHWQSGPFEFDAQQQTLVVHHHGYAVTLACDGGPTATACAFDATPNWWNQFHYPCETRRGQDDCEDAFVPGGFELELPAGKEHVITLTAALGVEPAAPLGSMNNKQRRLAAITEHLSKNIVHAQAGTPEQVASLNEDPARLHDCLAIASDDFVVERHVAGRRLMTVLAGYPWFADWGRDTFIALPGLLLCTGRLDEAQAVLEAFASVLHRGLVPNRFDDYDATSAHYNTVDAALWFVHAGAQYAQARAAEAGKPQEIETWLADAVCQVLDCYETGTLNNTHMDPADGLISAGDAHTQLTWMDAKCAGVVFTPRYGKAVEINALWHSDLLAVAELLDARRPDKAKHYRKLAKLAARGFKLFHRDDKLGLYDHVRPNGERDASIRPNQIFAASLPHSPLNKTLRKQVIAVVKKKLLTPVGLRTLPEDDAHYHPYYAGDAFHRDEAYHQGTIWPWLIGGYGEAVLRLGEFSPAARAEALAAIAPLLSQLAAGGLGQLHEIHEAATLRPVGSVAQAWSVAEVLRVYEMACAK